MAKNETAAVAAELNELEKVMENLGTPTLKAIAMVLGLQPVRLYYVAKQPKEGCVYDPKVYNWDAIMRFIEKRLNADEGLATFADVIEAALKKDEELKLVDGRRTSTGGSNKLSLLMVRPSQLVSLLTSKRALICLFALRRKKQSMLSFFRQQATPYCVQSPALNLSCSTARKLRLLPTV